MNSMRGAWSCIRGGFMSTIESGAASGSDDMTVSAPAEGERSPSFQSSIVPSTTIAGRSLVAIVAIMTFLASITAGGVSIVRDAAGDWQAEIAREVTIQIRAVSGRDIEADLVRAADIARSLPGVADVRIFSRDESARLLEPWLGGSINLAELPIPRIILVRIAANAKPDLARLRLRISEVPNATLDDHRSFVDRMRRIANAAVLAGIAVLALMVAATILSVTFATRAAIAANRPVVEVLHFVGAKNAFIAWHFQRHFLALALKGGLIGGGAAVAVFVAAQLLQGHGSESDGSEQLTALFGVFSVGISGYAIMLAQIALIAGVTALASRHAVNRTIETIE
jgi:cell division transport system permease protein